MQYPAWAEYYQGVGGGARVIMRNYLHLYICCFLKWKTSNLHLETIAMNGCDESPFILTNTQLAIFKYWLFIITATKCTLTSLVTDRPAP